VHLEEASQKRHQWQLSRLGAQLPDMLRCRALEVLAKLETTLSEDLAQDLQPPPGGIEVPFIGKCSCLDSAMVDARMQLQQNSGRKPKR